MIEIQYGINEKNIGLARWITIRIDKNLSINSLKWLDFYETGEFDKYGNSIDKIFFTNYIPDWYEPEAREWILNIINNFENFKNNVKESLEKETVIKLENNVELFATNFGDD